MTRALTRAFHGKSDGSRSRARGKRPGRRREKGNVIILVSLLGTVITALAVSAFLHAASTERESAEESLVRLRAYWAAMGTTNYVLSRVRATTACVCDSDIPLCFFLITTCNRDEDRILTLERIYDEITANHQRWTYRTYSSDYYLDTALTIENDEVAGGPNNAHLKMTVEFPDGGSTHAITAGIVSRLRPLEMRFCLGVASSGASCKNVTKNMNSASEGSGRSAIKTIRHP